MLDGDPAPLPKFLAYVYCGQTVGWIKMKLGAQVGLGPGQIVLDRDPVTRPQIGHSPPILGTYLLWLNGWIDQDATWYGGRPRPRPHCVTWGPSSPFPNKKGAQPPIFGPCLLWPNGCPSQLPLSTCWFYPSPTVKTSPRTLT